MSEKLPCEKDGHDFMYDDERNYRVCWVCGIKQKHEWVTFS